MPNDRKIGKAKAHVIAVGENLTEIRPIWGGGKLKNGKFPKMGPIESDDSAPDLSAAPEWGNVRKKNITFDEIDSSSTFNLKCGLGHNLDLDWL